MLKSLPNCHRSVRNDIRLFLRTKQYPVQLRTTKYWKVLPVLFCTTKYYSSTTLYYKVLLQYYSLCTTKYYSNTTLYYSSTASYCKYQSSTTKYYSSATSYFKVLVCTTKYSFVVQSISPLYSVLYNTTPVLFRTTNSTTSFYKALVRTTKGYSTTTKYCTSPVP